jgi:electron transport complex protein RnfB
MLLAVFVLAVIGAILGGGLGIAGRYFAVEDANPLQKEIEALMPGSQCGQCGFPGCTAAAAALAENRASVTCCPPGGRALAEKLAELLGVSLDASAMSAPLVAAIEEARCTGCTRCYRACPTDAIVGANGQIHVVLSHQCTGCGKCIEACPEDCLQLQPESVTLDTWHWTKPQVA